jgi:hypothetical protein
MKIWRPVIVVPAIALLALGAGAPPAGGSVGAFSIREAAEPHKAGGMTCG